MSLAEEEKLDAQLQHAELWAEPQLESGAHPFIAFLNDRTRM